jgi:hypothetical protein
LLAEINDFLKTYKIKEYVEIAGLSFPENDQKNLKNLLD